MDYEIMMNGNVKIGTYAPEFEASSSMGPISLNQYKGKWVVLFSHPGDFTPVRYNSGGVKLKNIKWLDICDFKSIDIIILFWQRILKVGYKTYSKIVLEL